MAPHTEFVYMPEDYILLPGNSRCELLAKAKSQLSCEAEVSTE